MDLVLEITRRCNIQCAHCLRGPAQRVDISDHILFKVVYHWPFSSFGIVTFTGGEPSLRPDRIRAFRNEMLMHRKFLDGWEFATNAKRITKPFLEALQQLIDLSDARDCDLNGIRISDDTFHQWQRGQHDERYKLYDFGELNNIPVYAVGKNMNSNPELILNSGRAKTNQLGSDGPTPDTKDWEYDINPDGLLDWCRGSLYVNVFGQIIDGCNYSYAEQKNHVLGSVETDNIIDIIKQHGHPYPDFSAAIGGAL